MRKKTWRMKVDTWLDYADRPEVAAGLQEVRDRRFRPMFEFLRPRHGPVRWPQLLAALHVAYAWMPTMLWRDTAWRRFAIGSECFSGGWVRSRVNDLNQILDQHRSGPLDPELVKRLMPLANNSVVGLSKVLFLFDPAHFPIWDSRVAQNYIRPKRAKKRIVTDKYHWYIDWVKDARAWASDDRVRREIWKLKSRNTGVKTLHNLRIVELVVFHALQERKRR